MTASIRFVLFDLDGTLVDSSPLHDHAFRVAISALRPSRLASFDYTPLRGLTTRDAFERLGEHDPDALDALVAAKRAAFRALAIRAFPGAITLLSELARDGIRAFVVTSAARASALATLRRTGLAPYVRGMIAAEDVSHGKPSPMPYLAALKRFALRAHEGLAVEDAESGLGSARAAGLTVVRVHGAFDPRERTAWAPDLDALRVMLLQRRAVRATVARCRRT